MPTYAIGDVQGCHQELLALLELIQFDRARDRVVFVGDLVNRGPDSLAVLRLVKDLGDAAVTVLGNHDLHLLAVSQGGKLGGRDTLAEVLCAPDCDALLDWLMRQPLAWCHPESDTLLVHAGLPPQWSVQLALDLAAEAGALIAGPKGGGFLRRMYGDEPSLWSPRLRGLDRTRFVVNCLTRMRYCDVDGRLDLRQKGVPGSQPSHLLPWFQVPGRLSEGASAVFGHWSTLGKTHWPEARVHGLDTGCVWGGRLTSLCLDDGRLQSVAGRAYSLID
ncbi:MAG: symmetrical bis(5'-nucleosyl)-tetraphosphatase [Panacagrimonas sp.]